MKFIQLQFIEPDIIFIWFFLKNTKNIIKSQRWSVDLSSSRSWISHRNMGTIQKTDVFRSGGCDTFHKVTNDQIMALDPASTLSNTSLYDFINPLFSGLLHFFFEMPALLAFWNWSKMKTNKKGQMVIINSEYC